MEAPAPCKGAKRPPGRRSPGPAGWTTGNESPLGSFSFPAATTQSWPRPGPPARRCNSPCTPTFPPDPPQ
eukprot:2078520-Lingulodinium_polyedra.AAC.1